jgi:Protein of unknown function (DUF3551)
LEPQAPLELLICTVSRLDYKTPERSRIVIKPCRACEEIMEMLMRRLHNIAVVALVLGAATMFGNAPASAVGTRHPFCIQGYEYPGLSNCSFDTYAQCQATASGRFLYCMPNPFFTGHSNDPYAYANRNRPLPRNYVAYPPNPYWGY